MKKKSLDTNSDIMYDYEMPQARRDNEQRMSMKAMKNDKARIQ